MSTAAIIVAAGAAGQQAPMRPTGVLSAAQRLILTFGQAGVSPVVLAAQDTPKLERHIAGFGAVLLKTNEDNGEMLHGVQRALQFLQGQCSRVFVTPVDVPLFTAQTLKTLLGTRGRAIAPSFNGKAGHPLLLEESLFAPVLAYNGPGGLRGALHSLGVQRTFVSVQDEGVLLNTRKDEEFGEALQHHSLRKLHPSAKLRLAKEQVFYGPGTQQLLRLVQNTGSVRLACRLMGISYSKGWKMISLMEEELGCQVVHRQQGGAGGGEAHLTPKGAQLVRGYEAFAAECKDAIEEIFGRHFGDGL